MNTIRLEVGSTKNRKGRTLPYDLLPEVEEVVDGRERLTLSVFRRYDITTTEDGRQGLGRLAASEMGETRGKRRRFGARATLCLKCSEPVQLIGAGGGI